MKKLYFSFLLSVAVFFTSTAQVTDSLQVYLDSINATFTYQHGLVEVKEGIAKINVPEGYKYLDAEQSRYVLTNLWGNPEDDSSLGMLFREKDGPMTENAYAIDITYSEDGYVSDEDAAKIDYAELLKDMQDGMAEENEYRAENGFATVDLIGWAIRPHYDKETNKLYWAKELHFDQQEGNTLNYNIRILGRNGFLMLNAIGDMNSLDAIQKDIPNILASVEFNEGSRYADFDPSVDKVAAYGIGGLIAGKTLAKLGFFALLLKYFKVILLVLLKFWKVVLLALSGAFMGLKKYLSRKKEKELEAATTPITETELPEENQHETLAVAPTKPEEAIVS